MACLHFFWLVVKWVLTDHLHFFFLWIAFLKKGWLWPTVLYTISNQYTLWLKDLPSVSGRSWRTLSLAMPKPAWLPTSHQATWPLNTLWIPCAMLTGELLSGSRCVCVCHIHIEIWPWVPHGSWGHDPITSRMCNWWFQECDLVGLAILQVWIWQKGDACPGSGDSSISGF